MPAERSYNTLDRGWASPACQAGGSGWLANQNSGSHASCLKNTHATKASAPTIRAAKACDSEHLRGEKSAGASAVNAQFAEMGAKSVTAGLRMQKELFETFQDISRDWFARATSEAELAFKLPRQLTNARSVPDAMSAYQEWLNEWLSMCGEDGRRLISDGQKIMDTGARCFANASPTANS